MPLLFFSLLSAVSAGSILVFPLDGSHWVNMKVLVEALHARGHRITVIRESDSWYISEKSPLYTSVTLTCRGGFEENFEMFLSRQLEILLQGKPSSFWSRLWTRVQMERLVLEQFSEFHRKVGETIVHMLEDEKLMQTLQAARYDLVLTDPGIGGGALLARWLKVPLVYNVRWTIQGEAHFLIAPSPLSYVPFTATELTDRMNFLQRVKNLLSFIAGTYTLSYITEPTYRPIVRRYFGPDEDYSTFFLDADIWLMRNDFIFEFPRPTMPNIIYMGGFQCKPAEPLPADLEHFVQASGDHGLIVMTLGTLVAKLPHRICEEIAAAFAQLPQKVIWRYVGRRPSTLGNNTLLVDWLPQKDLLGHPKTKVFVTHGGTNGVQEAIFYGVPVVGIPLFFDQPENLSRVRVKGAAVLVDVATLDRRVFGEAVSAVLQNSSYRDNMQTLSRLQRDQPIKPLDQAVFWVEHVIRHRGARHLQAQAHKMPWMVYHCLDVAAVLLAVALLLTLLCTATLRFLWRSVWKTKRE